MIVDQRQGGNRRTGATYRGLLQLINRCISFPGTKAVSLYSHDEAARHGMRMCFEMITPLLPNGFANMYFHRREIRFDNGSFIRFITPRTMEERMRGIHHNVGMLDNSLDMLGPSERTLAVTKLRGIVRD